MSSNRNPFAIPPASRRRFLQASACGFGSLAFTGLFANEVGNPLVPRPSHYAGRAKRVIFLFMSGGPSQVDTFDYKPELTKLHGKKTNPKAADGSPVYYQSPWKFSPRGKSGLLVSDL